MRRPRSLAHPVPSRKAVGLSAANRGGDVAAGAAVAVEAEVRAV